MELGELTQQDATSILERYALGKLVGLTRLPFHAHNAPYYRLETTSGRYFLKRYRRFTEHVDRGLDLIAFLRRKGYPAIEVVMSRDGAPHVTHQGSEVSLFEYLELPEEDWDLPPRRARALGDGLGALHAFANGLPLPETLLGHDEFTRRLGAISDESWMPAGMRRTLATVRELFPSLTVPADQPRGACHVEFGLEHVRFAGDQVLRVIDWDIVGADFLFRDLGTTLSDAVHAEGIDFPALAAIVAGYDARRALTVWERAHLYEAACYGACKYLIWELDPDWLARHDLQSQSLTKVDVLTALGKRGFSARLAAV